jgi:hypothetical protein
MTDIQGRRKGRALAALVLAAICFALGWWVGRASPSGPPPAAASTRPVDIRIDPSSVKLIDASLELRPLPDPPKQDLGRAP